MSFARSDQRGRLEDSRPWAASQDSQLALLAKLGVSQEPRTTPAMVAMCGSVRFVLTPTQEEFLVVSHVAR